MEFEVRKIGNVDHVFGVRVGVTPVEPRQKSKIGATTCSVCFVLAAIFFDEIEEYPY